MVKAGVDTCCTVTSIIGDQQTGTYWRGDQIGLPAGKEEQDRILVVVSAS